MKSAYRFRPARDSTGRVGAKKATKDTSSRCENVLAQLKQGTHAKTWECPLLIASKELTHRYEVSSEKSLCSSQAKVARISTKWKVLWYWDDAVGVGMHFAP